MSINILDSSIYNRIAAGEVVERPRSIVKELVENSLDAGATSVSVCIDGGGIKSIRVTDNGCGLEKSDLEKAFLPHATSKIKTAGDLDFISTLGFRGEALASIAAVSKVTMTTRRREEELGHFLTIDGGERVAEGECGTPQGTSVLVDDLFLKIPARRKFLGTSKAEEGEITSLIARLILANPDVSIKYTADGKTIFHSGGNGLTGAIFTVYGMDTLKSLVEIRLEFEDISVYGYVSRPGFSRHSRSFQTLLVNSRYVTDSGISNAVYACFKDYLMVRQYPMYIIFVDLPSDMADVNIHPSKQQVRFANPKRVLSVIRDAINTALYGASSAARSLTLADSLSNAPISAAEKERVPFVKAPENFKLTDNNCTPESMNELCKSEMLNKCLSDNNSVLPDNKHLSKSKSLPDNDMKSERGEVKYSLGGLDLSSVSFYKTTPQTIREKPFREVLANSLKSAGAGVGFYAEKIIDDNGSVSCDDRIHNLEVAVTSFNDDEALTRSVLGGENQSTTEMGEGIQTTFEFSEDNYKSVYGRAGFKHLGKLFNTYILLEIGNDFYMIDQHAAHERLIFDRLYAEAEKGCAVIQSLLVPLDFTLDHNDSFIIDENENVLHQCGVAIKKRSDGEYSLCGVPLAATGLNVSNFIGLLLESLKGESLTGARLVRERIITSACKAAVKGEDDLTDGEIEAILLAMSKTDVVSCPHGRPAVLKIPRAAVERWFRRKL